MDATARRRAWAFPTMNSSRRMGLCMCFLDDPSTAHRGRCVVASCHQRHDGRGRRQAQVSSGCRDAECRKRCRPVDSDFRLSTLISPGVQKSSIPKGFGRSIIRTILFSYWCGHDSVSHSLLISSSLSLSLSLCTTFICQPVSLASNTSKYIPPEHQKETTREALRH